MKKHKVELLDYAPDIGRWNYPVEESSILEVLRKAKLITVTTRHESPPFVVSTPDAPHGIVVLLTADQMRSMIAELTTLVEEKTEDIS